MVLLCLIFLTLCTSSYAGDLEHWQYVVDVENGSDQNSGQNPNHAFKTIGRCLEEVKSEGGDCFVRQGRYREQLEISGVRDTLRPVRIVGYQEEVSIWDGTYSIHPDQWTLDPQTGACSAEIDRDIFALFLDDDLLTPARWPNALWSDKTVFLVDHWRPTQEGSDRGLVVDESLATSGLDMTGAMAILNIGSWSTFVAKVDSHQEGSDQFTYNDTFGDIKFQVNHNHYYMESKLALLDAPEEWFYDSTTKLLRVIPPHGKTCQDLSNLRGRIMDYGLTITDSTNITIANLTFFGANINVDGDNHEAVSDIIFDSINFLFPSSSHRMLGDVSYPLVTKLESDRNRGGPVSVLNCTFHGAEGPTLQILASNSLVSNNLFTYNDWAGQNMGDTDEGQGVVASKTNDGIFSYNTLAYNGVSKGLHYSGRRDEIYMNHILGQCWGTIQNDGAGIQISPGAQDGVVVHHNWVHDSPKKGIRFDGSCPPDQGCGIHGYLGYNVAWASWDNKELCPKGENHTVEHNTAFDTDNECSLCVLPNLGDNLMNNNTVVINNGATVMAGGGGYIKDNYEGKDLTEYLVDVANFDFRPVLESPLILQDGNYIGAYRPNEDYYWIPGRKEYKTSFPIPKDGGFLNRGRAGDDAVICNLGYLAQRHYFYLGTSRDSVEEAGLTSPEYQYNTEGEENVFHLESQLDIEPGGKYFWRVDAERNGNVYKGDVWMFQT